MAGPHGFSAEDVKLIGELLVPMFKDALREEFHKVRNDANSAILNSEARLEQKLTEQTNDIDTLITALKHRVERLESNQWKALFGFGGLMVVVTVAWNSAVGWVKRKLGLQ